MRLTPERFEQLAENGIGETDIGLARWLEFDRGDGSERPPSRLLRDSSYARATSGSSRSKAEPHQLLQTFLTGHPILMSMVSKTSFSWEILATPLTYGVVLFLKKKENEDYFDTQTNFTPFKVTL